MGVLEVVRRIRQRVLMEMLDLDPIAEPPAPRADWPQWASNDGDDEADDSGKDVKIRVLSLNAWGTYSCMHALMLVLWMPFMQTCAQYL